MTTKIQVPIQVPIVHLNGTSKSALVDQLHDAHRACLAAVERLTDAAPNGRDYYPLGDAAFKAAREQHADRVRRVQSVAAELYAIWEAIEDGLSEAEVQS